jgi:hypothetical protein
MASVAVLLLGVSVAVFFGGVGLFLWLLGGMGPQKENRRAERQDRQRGGA